MEPVLDKLNFCEFQKIAQVQAVVEARLLPNNAKIAKVLSIAKDASVSLAEVFNSEARYSGRVNFKVIFVCTEGATHSMDYNAEFTDKIVCDKITKDTKPLLFSSVLDLNIVLAAETELKLACVVETVALAAVVGEVDALQGIGEQGFSEQSSIQLEQLVSKSTAEFTLSETIQIKNDAILLSESRVVVNSRKASFDSVIVSGAVICGIVFKGADDLIYQTEHTIPFTEEIAAVDCRDTHLALASVSIKQSNINIETDGEKSVALLEFVLSGSVKVIQRVEKQVITDVFSLSHELEKEVKIISTSHTKGYLSIKEAVSGTVTLDVEMPIVDQVLALTGGSVNITGVACEDGKILCEGIVLANIVYYSAETSVKHSVAVEIPFSISKDEERVAKGDLVEVFGLVGSTTSKILRGNEISIKASVELEAILFSSEEAGVISAITQGEEREVSTAAFSVHIGKKDEKLWDIAKSLSLSPEEILIQNEGLELPLAGGERIVVYRQKKVG